jgi:hypothetical protein
MPFFTDRELSTKPRTIEEVTPGAWRAMVAAIVSRINDGSFGHAYPETCPDARGITGTDPHLLGHAVKSVLPKLRWPLEPNDVPPGFEALDLIEFCYEKVAMPQPYSFHTFFGHEHLNFDVEAGRAEFRVRINQIFERNGMAFSLEPNGKVVRLTPMLLHEALSHPPFATGDAELDDLLANARCDFLSHDPNSRLNGLEHLWDAWERLKTLDHGSHRRGFSERLLHDASPEPHFRRLIDKESRMLTDIGEEFMVRRNETAKIPITAEYADYLFRRLWAMIRILVHALERHPRADVTDSESVQHV